MYFACPFIFYNRKGMKISPVLHMFIGLIAGLIVPLVFGWLFLRTLYSGDISLHTVSMLIKSSALIIKLLFVAILPNMLAVYLLNHLELWNYCRGVFVSIMIYIVVAVILS